jgi:hypothetical protein
MYPELRKENYYSVFFSVTRLVRKDRAKIRTGSSQKTSGSGRAWTIYFGLGLFRALSFIETFKV